MDNFSLDGVKNIIFDLGNVIVNLDMAATDNAFKKLSGTKYDEIMKALNETSFFQQYEMGKISTATFVSTLKEKIGGNTTANEVIDAWNAMLLDIPSIRYDILIEQKKKYRTFCLSNTNELHIKFLFNMLQKTKGLSNLDDFFERVYLSHEMGQRKPNANIFETVLKENNLIPSETLFIDDTAEHIAGAKQVAVKTFHLSEGRSLEQFF